MRRWFGVVLMLLGLALAGCGVYNWHALLGVPLDAQSRFLGQTIFPLIVGLWGLVGGLYVLATAG